MTFKKLFRFQATILGLSLVIFLSGCQQEQASIKPPNIVWIVSEDNSKHYLKHFDENGVATPNIESLAENGITFTRAFSNGAVCSVARSTIISGCYGPRVGTQFHRKSEQVPLPDSLRMFPAYLRDAGYYTVNNAKEDYNFFKGDDVWDNSSGKGTWKNRANGQPFFYVFNMGITHEGRLHFPATDVVDKPTNTKPTTDHVFPVHPDTELFRYTNARYRDQIVKMDSIVGNVLADLQEANLMDSTFIFYYGDHGGVLPGSKGYAYESGLHVPMIVHVPKVYEHLVEKQPGSSTEQFVSFTDLGPTVLNLAGVKVPEDMDGEAFLGKDAIQSNDVAYGYADRFDEKYDFVRTVRKGKYKYIRSYQPFIPDGLMNNYRYKQVAYQEWYALYKQGKLNETQAAFFKPRKAEMLFDLESDPNETNDLSGTEENQVRLLEMRDLLTDWVKGMPDLSFFPEHYFLNEGKENPTAFGDAEKSRIADLVEIADLQLLPFAEAREGIMNGLKSVDPWKRYWGIIVASSFTSRDEEITKFIAKLTDDEVAINRVRAYEYLYMSSMEHLFTTGVAIDKDKFLNEIYQSTDPVEALLMLNSVVMLQDFYGAEFNFDSSKLSPDLEITRHVEWRSDYLSL